MDRVTFGKRLETIRRSKGLSQLKMATACGLSSSHYAMIESGTRNPNFDTMVKISDGFMIPLADLLKDEVPQYPVYDEATNQVIAMVRSLPEEARGYAVRLVQVFLDSRK